jgi:D-amino-acid dehydrogenase
MLFFRTIVEGIQCNKGDVIKADIYVLATGIMSNPLGRSIGINLPVYPLRGNIATVPVKVNKSFNFTVI